MKPEIIFESDLLVVINKPAGLLSIPDREGKDISLKRILQENYPQIFTVHRLDRDTSGLIVFAKDEATHKFLSVAFESRTVIKDYLGLVSGTLAEKKKSIDAPIIENSGRKGTMIVHQKGKTSLTDYEVIEEFGKFSLLSFRIHTGRTHQIRVHMQNEGHPIVCDDIYGDGTPIRLSMLKKNYKLSLKEDEERPILNRLALHAWKLSLPLPEGPRLEMEAPLPKDLSALLQQLRKLKAKKLRQ
ncbi:MAG: RluA family pseudouridine synthase [Chitinophagaceae bacterium]|nr:RluA family pseudouridine synthase [Chitinophagaceae bacterium]